MNAIFKIAAEMMSACAGKISGAYAQFCQRLVGSDEPAAIRIAGSFVLMPLLLLATALACGVTSSLSEYAVLIISLSGFSMILCALALLGTPILMLGMGNFVAYAAALLAIGSVSGGNIVPLFMAAFLPLEIWLFTRKPWLTAAGFGVAAVICGYLIIGSITTISLAALSVPVIYAALLTLRVANATRQLTVKDTVTPAMMHVGGDVRFCLDADGKVLTADAQTTNRLGARAGGLNDVALLDHVHVTDRVQYLSMLADLRAGIAVRSVDVKLRALENGRVIFQPYRIDGVVAHDGVIALTGRSLESEQKLLDEIDALKVELAEERANKSHLLASVSHELRTPLNAIIGFSDMLSNGIGCDGADNKQREYAGIIHRSGHYLLELVNAVLDSSRLETGTYRIEPKSFAFKQAVEMCTNVLLPQAGEKGVAFCHRVSTDIGELVADQRAVQQILINLSANAVKFTERGGCVTIDAARIATEGRPMLEIRIADNGIGMEADDLERIGTPFMRADNSYTRAQEGSGLGLCVVKGLVELHQGSITFKSRPGEGTVVTVRLPLAGPINLIGDPDNFVSGNEQHSTGMVIEMARHQGERHNDWQKDSDQDQNDAQTRKTA